MRKQRVGDWAGRKPKLAYTDLFWLGFTVAIVKVFKIFYPLCCIMSSPGVERGEEKKVATIPE